MEYFYSISDRNIFLIMVLITTSFSIALITLNKYYIFYRLKYRDNTITASMASLIGIIYGVLAGVICLYLINNNDHATTAAMNEGTAAANIYRESKWLQNPARQQLQSELRQYIDRVITTEWPLMKAGKSPDITNVYIINEMSDTLKQFKITSQSDYLIVENLLREIKSLYDARQQRILMSENQLPADIWTVILIGTILLVVINYAFRVGFYLHLFSITVFSIMAASILFLLITLDRPFQGEFIIAPDALQAVLTIMKHDTGGVPKPSAEIS
ncbi:MAG TPA: DUF4239 domain-containing protein [Gammaproteobacteria bacterium]|nr:DUF4239 domain-containing protein [Gammaproteobacteria bacterium]